jgi:GTP cyclohydrolase IB
MADIQDGREERGIALDRVGITRLTHPVSVRDRRGRVRETAAAVSLFIGLPQDARAAHMSRFLGVLGRHTEPLDAAALKTVLEDLRTEHSAPTAGIELAFQFFVEKRAPATGAKSLMACEARIAASLDASFDLVTGVRVPVMTLCPCSVSVAGTPGLGQRGYVSVSVRSENPIGLEDLVELVESRASSPVFPLLKAEDERSLLASALARPMFVEDLVRDVAQALDADERISWYKVEAENLESIHDHSAFASRERRR